MNRERSLSILPSALRFSPPFATHFHHFDQSINQAKNKQKGLPLISRVFEIRVLGLDSPANRQGYGYGGQQRTLSAVMDRFIVSLPKGVAGQKRSSSSSGKHRREDALGTSKKTPEAKKPKQSYIDLGQKSFGANIACKVCGMFYVKGDPEDEKRHVSFCQKVGIERALLCVAS
jgi:zinc-finger of acetyl-transferase ESCO